MELDELMNELDTLLKKYCIEDIVLLNFDDNKMGCRQLSKITETDIGKFLVLGFSGKGETLCPCCARKEKDCEVK